MAYNGAFMAMEKKTIYAMLFIRLAMALVMFAILSRSPTVEAKILTLPFEPVAPGMNEANAFYYGRNAYYNNVESIRSGDVVRFSDGATFMIDGLLGSGYTSRVYSLKGNPDVVLRIPWGWGLKHYIDETVEGYSLLRAHGIPSVKVIAHRASEYVLVTRVSQNHLSFREFAIDIVTGKDSPDPEYFNYTTMWSQFLTFLDHLQKFSKIGDLKDENLVYDGTRQEWIVLDWTKDHVVFDPKSDPSGDTVNPLQTLISKFGIIKHGEFVVEVEHNNRFYDVNPAPEVAKFKALIDAASRHIVETRVRGGLCRELFTDGLSF
jgi:hypothetical protein